MMCYGEENDRLENPGIVREKDFLIDNHITYDIIRFRKIAL